MNKFSPPNDLNKINALQSSFMQHLLSQGKTPNTLKNYKNDIEGLKHLLSFKEELATSSSQIEALSHYIFTHYPCDNSRRRKIQTLRIFFDYLVHQGEMSENPLRKLPTAPKILDIPQPPSFDQVARLWHYLSQQKQLNSSEPPVAKILNLRNMLLFVLIYKCGLKAQDLAGLAKCHAIISGPKSRHRIIVTPRKRDPYTIPLPPIFSGLFIEYDQLIKKHFHKEWELNESLLVTANHFRIIPKAISVRGLEMVFEDLRRKANLNANFNAKTLRQAGIFCWLHEGHHENLIKEWLGVAPSYSLSPYSDHKWQNIFQDHFLRTLAKKEDEKANDLLEEENASHPQ